MKSTEILGNRHVGRPVDRVDGFAKVTGEAKYAAEFSAPGLLYGVVVSSGIAKGKITKLEVGAARAVSGVVDVLTHENRPDLAWFNRKYADQDSPPGQHFRALYDAKILYSGQPIALVVADNFEAARYAASLVRPEYEREAHVTDLKVARRDAFEPKHGKSGFEPPASRGDAAKAFAKCAVRVEADYEMAMEHHNPMEMHASTVIRDVDGNYTVYDKTQGTLNSQNFLCQVFGLDKKKVRVLAPFVGGAFGSGLRPQYQLYLAMMAAEKLKASVRVVLTRQQMFSFGHRPAALQTLALGSDADGKLESIRHEVVCETSKFEDYTEVIVNWSGMLYQCDDVELKHKLARLDAYTPLDMRAPGATTGVCALECAVDELAEKAGLDPLELRLRNYSDKDQMHHGRSFSSKALRACYEQASARFGWKDRPREPRRLRDGKKLVGWGHATGVWDAMHMQAKATAKFSVEGKLHIRSGITDIGTGTSTILTQIAAETLGLAIEDIDTKIGDSDFPTAPLQGGSWTASTVGAAVHDACEVLRKNLLKLAGKIPDSAFEKIDAEEVEFVDRELRLKSDPSKALKLTEILRLSGLKDLEEKGSTNPNLLKAPFYSRNTHSAVFVEVKIDEDFAMIEVPRVVIAVAAGRILNPKTARSQILGGVVWGISHALFEESVTDHKLGRIMNHSFAEYHIPVNKDIGEIDVIFVPEEDTIASPIGVKGLGEIGIVGTAAAVANAVYHATGATSAGISDHAR